MTKDIQELEEAIAKLEEEKSDLEKMFHTVRPTAMSLAGEEGNANIVTGPLTLFAKYERRHRERMRDIEIEVGYKKTKLANLQEK